MNISIWTQDELDLDSASTGLSQARAAIGAYVSSRCAWVPVYQVQVVASELLTNALKYAGGWWRLKVRCGREKLVVEVSDHDSRLPEPREPDLAGGTGGFGMYLVASLSSDFEAKPTPDGKTVRATWLAHAM